ncbi:TPA: hypothetical protein DCE37_26320 [Candidatus Latescibacteria bacterium]|nr:hypothetical protein [Candidatus Latescibacterota bacterium]
MADTPDKQPSSAGKAIESIILFVLLMTAWLLLSGHYTPLAIGFGVVSCATAVYLTKDRPLIIGGAGRSFGVPLGGISYIRLFIYPFRLFYDVVSANLQVAAILLSPKQPIDPAFIKFRTTLKRSIPQTFFGNHITLTPGTITVDIDEGRYLVHTLNPKLAGDVSSGDLANRIAATFGEEQGESEEMTDWIRSSEGIQS